MASLKDAKAIIEEGGGTIWGQLPDIPYKSDKFGLGFTLDSQRVVHHARANSGRPPFRINNNGVHKKSSQHYGRHRFLIQCISKICFRQT